MRWKYTNPSLRCAAGVWCVMGSMNTMHWLVMGLPDSEKLITVETPSPWNIQGENSHFLLLWLPGRDKNSRSLLRMSCAHENQSLKLCLSWGITTLPGLIHPLFGFCSCMIKDTFPFSSVSGSRDTLLGYLVPLRSCPSPDTNCTLVQSMAQESFCSKSPFWM